jgi:hypothetical protein
MAAFVEPDGMSLNLLSPLNETQRLVWSYHLLVGFNGFLATKHLKKHQNGHLPGVNNHL